MLVRVVDYSIDDGRPSRLIAQRAGAPTDSGRCAGP